MCIHTNINRLSDWQKQAFPLLTTKKPSYLFTLAILLNFRLIASDIVSNHFAVQIEFPLLLRCAFLKLEGKCGKLGRNHFQKFNEPPHETENDVTESEKGIVGKCKEGAPNLKALIGAVNALLNIPSTSTLPPSMPCSATLLHFKLKKYGNVKKTRRCKLVSSFFLTSQIKMNRDFSIG